MNLNKYLIKQIAWSSKTFGNGERSQGIVDHIRKELVEIEEKPNDLEEWIDVVILALDGAWREGYSPDQIANALQHKLTKNKSRKWPDWRAAEDGKAIEHIRNEATEQSE